MVLRKLKQIFRFIYDSDFRFDFMSSLGLTKGCSDELFIKKMFKIRMGKNLNLENPRTFNEKLNWLKLYNRKPLYTILVDKYAVKNWVAEKIGTQYVIPTLGVWERFDDIAFDNLPNQFVLKCTHDSGGLVICKNKNLLDRNAARKVISKALKQNFYYKSREWPYKNVPPRIIAEKYMEDESGELRDYKLFCFDGEVKALFVATDRQNKNVDTKFDFFDRNFNHLPFTKGHPNADCPPQKPIGYEKMVELAEVLSSGIPHVRVDFYEISGQIFFGEMTFFDNSGFVPFKPEKYDLIWGDWLNLPSIEVK